MGANHSTTMSPALRRIDTLKCKREDIKNTLISFKQFLETMKENPDYEAIQTRCVHMNSSFSKMEEIHYDLMEADADAKDDHKTERAEIEQIYLDVVTDTKKILKKPDMIGYSSITDKADGERTGSEQQDRPFSAQFGRIPDFWGQTRNSDASMRDRLTSLEDDSVDDGQMTPYQKPQVTPAWEEYAFQQQNLRITRRLRAPEVAKNETLWNILRIVTMASFFLMQIIICYKAITRE